MKFTVKSKIAQSYAVLLLAGIYESIEEVPDAGNLREVVLEILTA